MTLSVLDFQDPTAHYAYQCATCAARYIVNIQPTQGNGGTSHRYSHRPMPKGADEAKAMALHCCHDNPEPPNGQNVYWAASHVVGSHPQLHLGDTGGVDNTFLEGGLFTAADEPEDVEELRQIETVFVNETEIWPGDRPSTVLTSRSRNVFASGQRPNFFRVRRLDLDVILDETSEGRRRDWASLLRHLKISARVGERAVTGFRVGEEGFFFQPRSCWDCQHSKFLDRIGRDATRTAPVSDNALVSRDDDPLMFHAATHFDLDLFEVPPRSQLSLTLDYRGPLVSIGFLRIITVAVEILPII